MRCPLPRLARALAAAVSSVRGVPAFGVAALVLVGVAGCSISDDGYRALAPAKIHGIDCTEGPGMCPLPHGITVTVTNLRRNAPAPVSQTLPSEEFYAQVDLTLSVHHAYAIASGIVELAPPEATAPVFNADFFYNVIPEARACSAPAVVSQRRGGALGMLPGAEERPPPVMNPGHYGPFPVCFAVAGVPSEPLQIT